MAIDPEAEALPVKNDAAMLALRSYAAKCWTTITFLLGHCLQHHWIRYEVWDLKKLRPAGSSNRDIAASLYQVRGIPTQFVIDRAGIVRASFVGFNQDEAPLRGAIEAALKR